MKKIIFISICLFTFYMNNNACSIMNNALTNSSICQSSDWESLGDITAISQYGEKKSFGLFVKVVNGKEFYQVRPLINKGYVATYSVTRGLFTFKGVQYNAKFSILSTTYYFDISN